MHEYRKRVGSSVYSQVHNKDWLPTYNKYSSYDSRIVKITRIEDSSIFMEKLEGFTLDNKRELAKLDAEEKRFIINEVFDIYNKQFNFKDSTLGPSDVWAHGDFCMQNLMYCNGKVKLIDPEEFDKRSLKVKQNSMRYGKFFETYIDLCCLVLENVMYRPLPDGLTIKESNVQGLGLFATKDFDADMVLGIVHIMNKNFPHGAIRTALGAFYNHSEEPNCKNVRGFWHQIPVCYLITVKPIKAGEELTAKYTLYKDFNE